MVVWILSGLQCFSWSGWFWLCSSKEDASDCASSVWIRLISLLVRGIFSGLGWSFVSCTLGKMSAGTVELFIVLVVVKAVLFSLKTFLPFLLFLPFGSFLLSA